MASSSCESVPCLLRPTFALPTLSHTPTSCVNWTQLWECHYIVTLLTSRVYLDLSVSRQDGRYLSNSMVKLAFSDWTSLLSIQLETGGFQPRSAGLMYRIPGKKNNEYNTCSDYSTYTHGWINKIRVTGASICCWAPFAPLTLPACVCATIPPLIMHKADYTIQSLHW